MIPCTEEELLLRLLLDPFGIEFGNEEIVNTRLGIAIKPAACRASDEDIPDSIDRNSGSNGRRANRAQLTRELFDPIIIIFLCIYNIKYI